MGQNKTVMEITIGDDIHYLNDVEFWCNIERQESAAPYNRRAPSTQTGVLAEMSALIDSIEIYADGQKLCYISNARYLLSILNQKKGESQE